MSKTAHQLTIFFGVLVGALVVLLYGYLYYTKSFSPEEVAFYSNDNGLEISVKYSRPSKKGRRLFGNDALVPFGEVWRTGANEAPVIAISKDIVISGRILSAGNYSMFSIPEPGRWIIIFNRDSDQWGSFNYNQDLDVLRVEAPSYIISNDVEKFTIEFVEGSEAIEMRLLWGQTLVTVPILMV